MDLMICILSVWLSYLIRLDEWGLLNTSQWLVVITSVAISFPLFIFFGLYRAIFRHIGSVAATSILNVFLIYFSIFFSIFTIVGINSVPRSLGALQPILFFTLIGLSRYLIRGWLNLTPHQKSLKFQPKSVALIYGAGYAGRQLAAAFGVSKDTIVAGFIDDDFSLQGNTINGLMVYSNLKIDSLIFELGITDIFLAIPSATQTTRLEIINSLQDCEVRVRTLPTISSGLSGKNIRPTDLLDLDVSDLLGRNIIPSNAALLKKNIEEKVVLITGAGGSIGSELCRTIIQLSPKSLIIIDNNEHSLYLIYEELKKQIEIIGLCTSVGKIAHSSNFNNSALFSAQILIPYLASTRDENLMLNIFTKHKPNTVFHAAAYKHVPMVEQNPVEGIKNNLLSTLACARASLEAGVDSFTLISTDKAVRPTNIMGASKRISELALQAIAEDSKLKSRKICFSMVRFGNVLGSSGSVVPLFKKQIQAGGPITVTHPEVTRYFMTIPEAAELVIQSSAMASGGDVFVLDMGQPIRIYDLALKMVLLSGLIVKDELHPYGDIEIEFTGLRPGEKLYEELLIGNNPLETMHPKIMKAHENFLPLNQLQNKLDDLYAALETKNVEEIKASLVRLVPEYHSESRSPSP